MSDTWRTRLLDAIEKDERSDRAISQDAGLGVNFVGQMRGTASKPGKNPSIDHVRKLAAALGKPLSSIVGEAAPGLRRVVVKAHVQAGAFAESWEWEREDWYDVFVMDLPELSDVNLYAAETRGPSMNRRWHEKTVVVFTNIHETQEPPIVGKRYIVERRRVGGDAEHTVKLLHQDSHGRYWLMPESDDPEFQAPISVEDGVEGETVAILGRVHFAVTRE